MSLQLRELENDTNNVVDYMLAHCSCSNGSVAFVLM